MKNLSCSIDIGKVHFDYVIGVNIKSSIDTLTDTCTINVPRKLTWKDKIIALGEEAILKRGNAVEIKLGYSNPVELAFKGYLKNIKAEIPVELECEDLMYKLKTKPVTHSYKSVDLQTLLNDILPGNISFTCVDVDLGMFRIKQATPAKVLQELKETYGLYSYFREGILWVGLAYWEDYRQTHKFKFAYNIKRSNLEFRQAEDQQVKVKAISILPDNKKLEVEVGDPEGETRTLHFYNITKEADLKKLAEEEIKKYRYDGYRGKFTAFGEPFVRIGDAVTIIDDERPERDGTYLVKAVDYSFAKGGKGFSQVIEIDFKI